MLVTEGKRYDNRVAQMFYGTRYITGSKQYKIAALQHDVYVPDGNKKVLIPADTILTLGPNEEVILPDDVAHIVYFTLLSIRCPVPDQIVRDRLHNRPIPKGLSDEDHDTVFSMAPFYCRDKYPGAVVSVYPCLFDTISATLGNIGYLLNEQPDPLWSCSARGCLSDVLISIRDREIPSGRSNAVIQHALDYIHAHISSSPSVTEIAHEVGMTADDLSRVFAVAVGQSVRDYISRCRQNYASYKLRTTEIPIEDVAFLAGYPSIKALEGAIRRHHGMSPTQFRIRGKIDRNTNWPGWMQRPVEL